MSRLPIDIGTAINAGDGEALRNAFDKINQMTQEIYSILTVNGIDPTFIPAHAITNGRLAQMGAGTVKGNVSGGQADAADVSIAALGNALGLNSFPVFGQDIINGNFEIWQRATSFTANGYTADRWNMAFTTGSVTTSRQVPSAGDAIAGQEIAYYLRQAVSGQSAGATPAAYIEQRLESVRAFAGQQVTFSFYARRASGSGNAAVEIQQNFGAGGSPSSVVSAIGVTTIALTTSWARYTVTVTLPNCSGKTFGSTDDGYLTFRIWTSAGTNFNGNTNSLGVQTIAVDLWGVKIDRGAFATAFIQRPAALELAMCQRYFCNNGNMTEYHIVPAPAATFSSTYPVPYPATMRISPTPSLSYVTTNATSSVTVVRSGTRGFVHLTTASANTNAVAEFNWSASAEL